MILEEFTSLVSQFLGNEFPIREIPLCFNNSITTQIDEINSDRFYCMTFPEFIESICRVIDIDSPKNNRVIKSISNQIIPLHL